MIAVEMEPLSVNSSSREIEDYIERFEIWCLTKRDLEEQKKTAYFLHFIGKDAYSLVKNLAFPATPVNLTYAKLKELLLKHFKPINFIAAERV